MSSQKVEYISLKDLVLWSENPRDPFSSSVSDLEIIDAAVRDRKGRWALRKLANQMGDSYDFSEIPTVVYHGKIPVVYDGNRRVILGKLFNGLVKPSVQINFNLPSVPMDIPCNVCSKSLGLKHVWRKHGDSGSWNPLERDIFLNKHMGEEKSTFLIFDEQTGGLISNNPCMNKVFVKEEIFKDSKLNELGFYVDSGVLKSQHNKQQVEEILKDIVSKVDSKEIDTRNNRGQVFGVLDPYTKKIVQGNANKPKRKVNISSPTGSQKTSQKKKTRVVKPKGVELFGDVLFLRAGDTNNLYRDIDALYKFYINPKSTPSPTFHILIRMALRLLCETAGQDCNGMSIDQYVKKYFDSAKSNLDKDSKTFLSNQQVKKNSIVQLLQTGAHSYKTAITWDQSLAISVILGAMLSISHKR